MAGPVVAALGAFAFEAHGFGLTELARSTRTEWAAIQVAGGMDRLQWTGGESDTLSIKGVLFPETFGGLASLNGIRDAAMAGTPLMFVNYAGQIFGLHVIESIDEDRSLLDRNGLPRRDAYTLNLRRYQGGDFSPQSVLIGLFN
jgi:hypothetical protein